MVSGRRLSRETRLLGGLCLADLLMTVYLLHIGRAVEANPLLAMSVEYGLSLFIVVKLLFTLLPLIVLEWLRWRRGAGIQRVQRLGIAAYVLLYVMGSLGVNG